MTNSIEREDRKKRLIRNLATTVAVVYFMGAMVVVTQGGDLPPFYAAPYVTSPAVSGVTIGISQQIVATNTITGEHLIGDMPAVQLVAEPAVQPR
jgi:hypothetical protein